MSLALRGGGLGALVAVVGMWLGGPLATGVAWADGGDGDGPAGSRAVAESGSSEAVDRRAQGRAVRESQPMPARRVASDDRGLPRAAASLPSPVESGSATPPADRIGAAGREIPLMPRAPGRSVSDAPVAAGQSVGAAAAVAARSPRLGVTAGSCGSCWAFGALADGGEAPSQLVAPSQVMNGFATAVERLLDTVGQWLSGLPANPVTEFLSGALWLVRRTLFPVGDGVGMFGAAACVATKDCTGQDLTGADLAGQDLSGVDFSRATLTAANLSNATMIRTKLLDADLTEANLSGATLTSTFGETDLSRANLTNSNLTEAKLSGVSLAGAKLTGAVLDRAVVRGALFTYADLAGVKLAGLDLSYTELISANLTGTDLTNANLAWADLGNANLTNAILYGANLTNADMGGDFPATMTGADLRSANLSGTDLRRVNLAGATLRGANLSGADLRDKDLSGTDLSYANLTGALVNRVKLAGANLNGAKLPGVNLSGSDLTGVSARDATLTDANLSSANLTKADLTFAVMSGANLSGANLTEAVLRNAKLIRASLTGADLKLVDFRYADLTGVDLSGRSLAGFDFIQANLSGANLTSTKLIGSSLMRANLSGANLTLTDLTAANLVDSVLANAIWDRTTCPDGSQSSTGCSVVPPLQTAPPDDWGARRGFNGRSWYEYRTPLLGTSGAPITNRAYPFTISQKVAKSDGIQGTITNSTNRTISVRIYLADDQPEYGGNPSRFVEAVLLPGASMPYRMETWGVDGKALADFVYTLAFFRYENGQAVGADGVNPSPPGAARLYLFDPYADYPQTRFAPPGQGWVNYRSDLMPPMGPSCLSCGMPNTEIWDLADGRVEISVKREVDGWTLTPSAEFLRREYFDTEPNDYAIFTIDVKSL